MMLSKAITLEDMQAVVSHMTMFLRNKSAGTLHMLSVDYYDDCLGFNFVNWIKIVHTATPP